MEWHTGTIKQRKKVNGKVIGTLWPWSALLYKTTASTVPTWLSPRQSNPQEFTTLYYSLTMIYQRTSLFFPFDKEMSDVGITQLVRVISPNPVQVFFWVKQYLWVGYSNQKHPSIPSPYLLNLHNAAVKTFPLLALIIVISFFSIPVYEDIY